MDMHIRPYLEGDLPAMAEIWNAIVERGDAFPQEERLGPADAKEFFGGQTLSAVAQDMQSGEIGGLYILHPNNVGRCGHIANASYAVKEGQRGQGTGRALVLHSLESAKNFGFKIMQFNAVVKTNEGALALYESLGFTRLGVIKNGFRLKDGTYEDIVPMVINL